MPENGNEHLRHFISAASLETTPVLGMLSWGMREKEGGGEEGEILGVVADRNIAIEYGNTDSIYGRRNRVYLVWQIHSTPPEKQTNPRQHNKQFSVSILPNLLEQKRWETKESVVCRITQLN